MAEFLTQADIGNRALQHCGAEMMDATLGFSEPTKRARQVSFAYGKLRRAELERNTWTFATRRAMLYAVNTNTMLLAPAVWASTTTYFVGSIVSDGSNNLWISRVPNNLANDPQNTLVWEPYFGAMTVELYVSTTSYYAGDLVYTTAGDGTYRVYISLQSANSDTPATATAWAATATYSKNRVVTYLSVAYMSLIDLNVAQTPNLAPALWAVGTTYGAAAKVGGSDGVIYQSIAGGNVGHDPATDAGVNWTNTGVLNPWTTVFTGGAGSLKWLEIGGKEFPMGVGLSELGSIMFWPIGAGPSPQLATSNVFRLPAGYLKECSQDPKAGGSSIMGAPTNLAYKDWLIEGQYVVSRETGPIMFRFVADITDVTQMKSMFCEGLACRIALEVCEPLTQSSTKIGIIDKEYQRLMGEARLVNAIESGSEEAPLDDWIACRY
jgi:hypothetical protein